MFSLQILTFSGLQPFEQEMAGFAQGKQCNLPPKTLFFVLCFSAFELSLPTNHFIKKRHPMI